MGNNTFRNLLDFDIQISDDPEVAGNGEEIYRSLLGDFFFKDESDDKNFSLFIKNQTAPDFFKNAKMIAEIPMEEIEKETKSETITETLGAKIYFSSKYLRSFYQNHPPEFAKLPHDIQQEIVTKAEEKNLVIFDSFRKLHMDLEAMASMTVFKVVSLALKVSYLKSAFPLVPLSSPLEDVIGKIFHTSNELFSNDPNILNDVKNDQNLRELSKTIFRIRSAKDIKEVTDMIKVEIIRFEKRLARVS